MGAEDVDAAIAATGTTILYSSSGPIHPHSVKFASITKYAPFGRKGAPYPDLCGASEQISIFGILSRCS